MHCLQITPKYTTYLQKINILTLLVLSNNLSPIDVDNLPYS